MEKKRILVFGAAGFIGTYLIDELLHLGHTVTASDINRIGAEYYMDNNIPYYPVDITSDKNFDVLSQQEFDTVIHLAALQPANFSSNSFSPRDYISINVNGTMNILEFCRRKNIKTIIYASSHRNTSGLWKYGKAIKEEDGRSQEYEGEYAMFSISESAAQDCVEFYRANYNLQGIIFRLPPVYGFGPHLEIFKNNKPIKTGFQTFIENAKACRPIEVWGDQNVGRDIIYVKDVVDAFVKAIENTDAGGLYNITSGYRLTLKEEVETIAKVFWGNNEKPQFIERPDKPHTMDSFVYDNTKAKLELGWSPKYNFESMLYDYMTEVAKNKFGFLIKKRQDMFAGEQGAQMQ